MRGLGVLVLVAGCYAPQAGEGAPCVTSDQCPSRQRCSFGLCSLTDRDPPPADAAPDAPPDAAPLACTTDGLACPGTAIAFSCGSRCWVRCSTNVTHDVALVTCSGWQGTLGEIDDAAEQNC